MACGVFKDLPKRTASDKALRDKGLEIPSDLTYDRYQRGLVLMISKVFDKNVG